MSFHHMYLVRICDFSTSIWSGYVIPPNTSGPDMSFIHIHLVWICLSFTYIWSWRNDISGPDACGGITYPDQMHVEELHIQTKWVWRGMIYPDQMHVE
jgi:hypothetical protein